MEQLVIREHLKRKVKTNSFPFVILNKDSSFDGFINRLSGHPTVPSLGLMNIVILLLISVNQFPSVRFSTTTARHHVSPATHSKRRKALT